MQKGQVTLFIILGMLIILSASVLVYYQFPRLEQFLPFVEQVPVEVLPVKQFVTSCLEQTAQRAITQLAKQGGIINTTQLLALPYAPTEGEALSIAHGWTVPYWWYLYSPNACTTCTFKEFFPKLHAEQGPASAEEQLALFIAEQIPLCAGSFSQFSGISVAAGAPMADVFVAEDAVHVNLLYPLIASINGKEHMLSRFYTQQEVMLPQLYRVAQAIAKEEQQQHFLEQQAMELVTVYSGLSKEKLPPVSETAFFLKPLFWTHAETQKNLQNIFGAYLNRLQMRTSRNAQQRKIDATLPYSAVLSQFYDSFLISTKEQIPYQTHFQYFPAWTIFLSLNNGEQAIFPEQAIAPLLPIPFVLQRYTTQYDISFPLLVELSDNRAFHGKGLSFFFALEGNVRANGLMNQTRTQNGEQGEDEGILCDYQQYNTENTTITVRDSLDAPVAGAVVSFSAGDTCLIGETNSKGKLTTAFPVGIGVLTVQAQSGISLSHAIKTVFDSPSQEDIIIPAMGKIPIRIKTKNKIYDSQWIWGNDGVLDTEDTALIIFTRLQEPGDGEYRATAQFTKETPIQNTELAAGTYNVQILLFQERNLTLVPQKQCMKTSSALGFAQQEQCITIPEEKMTINPPAMNVETTMTLSPEDVQQKKQLTIHAPKAIYPQTPTYDMLFIDQSQLAYGELITK